MLETVACQSATPTPERNTTKPILSPHGGEYEIFLSSGMLRPDEGSINHLWNAVNFYQTTRRKIKKGPSVRRTSKQSRSHAKLKIRSWKRMTEWSYRSRRQWLVSFMRHVSEDKISKPRSSSQWFSHTSDADWSICSAHNFSSTPLDIFQGNEIMTCNQALYD